MIPLLIMACAAAVASSAVLAGELLVEVRRLPDVQGKPLPAVQVVGNSIQVSPLDAGRWQYELDQQVVGNLKVVPGKDDVPEYEVIPITMKLPFTVRRPVGVLLYSTKREPVTAKAASAIYRTDLNGKSPPFLWQFYHRTQLQARERFKAVAPGAGTRELNSSDVRVFFKALEVARELGRRNYLAISPDVQNIKEHLEGLVDQPAPKLMMQKALGAGNLNGLTTVMQEIEALDAAQYAAMYRYITEHKEKGRPEARQACQWYRMLDADIAAMEENRALRIQAHDRLGHLLTQAVNDCVGKKAIAEVKKSGSVSDQTKAEAKSRLERTEKLSKEKVIPIRALAQQREELSKYSR